MTPSTNSNPHQPGKSWVVINDDDGSFNITLHLGFGKKKLDNYQFTTIVVGLIALLVVTAISCGMNNLCKRRDSEEDQETSSLGNSAMVYNGLNKEERCGL